MKNFVMSAVCMLLFVAIAAASSFTPSGGSTTNPAPDNDYTGDVAHSVSGNTELIFITEEDGDVLKIEKGDCSDAEWNALVGAAPGDGDATVTMLNGAVDSVLVH